LGRNWRWLAASFALFGGLAGFGIGNMVQSNSISSAMHTAFGLPTWVSGLVLATLTGTVILGGIRRIGRVAELMVPAMCVAYILCVGVVLFVFSERIPAALDLIFTQAFQPTAAGGGFLGATVMMAVRMGVARGIFSNEA